MIDFNINELLFLNDLLAHKIDDQLETINCLQEENKKLHAELTDSKNDLKQAVNEIKLLNKQIDKLIAENNDLRLKNKMLTKIGLNSYYEIYACKKHCCYADTDSIKEINDNDDNN